MTFGEVPAETAEGAILAHSVNALARPYAKGQTYRIAKGTFLQAAHVEDLLAAGTQVLTVARLDAGDVHEDRAAETLARALLGNTSGVRLTVAATGRVNLRAERAGLVALNMEAIHAANRVNPGITVATVPHWQRLDPRGLGRHGQDHSLCGARAGSGGSGPAGRWRDRIPFATDHHGKSDRNAGGRRHSVRQGARGHCRPAGPAGGCAFTAGVSLRMKVMPLPRRWPKRRGR